MSLVDQLIHNHLALIYSIEHRQGTDTQTEGA